VAVLILVVLVSGYVSAGSNASGAGNINTPRRVVDRVDELVQLLLLVLRQRARLLVPARVVNVQRRRHGCEGVGQRGSSSCARAVGLLRLAGWWGGQRFVRWQLRGSGIG
jgi:hypothetical protein